jgi:hypothetical protein
MFKQIIKARRSLKKAGKPESIDAQIRRHKTTWLYILAGYQVILAKIWSSKKFNIDSQEKEQREAFAQAVMEQNLTEENLDNLADIKRRTGKIFVVMSFVIIAIAFYFAFAGDGVLIFLCWIMGAILSAVMAMRAYLEAWCIRERRFGTFLDWARAEDNKKVVEDVKERPAR